MRSGAIASDSIPRPLATAPAGIIGVGWDAGKPMQGREVPSAGWGEFLVVMGVAFGVPIYVSVSTVLATTQWAGFSDSSLVGMAMWELTVLTALGFPLWVRGWAPQMLGLRFQWGDIPPALVLFVASLAAVQPLNLLESYLSEAANPSFDVFVSGALSLSAIVALSVVNPIFEEVFVCAYAIRVLERKYSQPVAVNVSIAIRASYHLYQGALGTLAVIVFGLIVSWWFARTGRLWPVIIAHGLLDLIALAVYT